jgi:hypothetical protein
MALITRFVLAFALIALPATALAWNDTRILEPKHNRTVRFSIKPGEDPIRAVASYIVADDSCYETPQLLCGLYQRDSKGIMQGVGIDQGESCDIAVPAVAGDYQFIIGNGSACKIKVTTSSRRAN